MQSHTRTVTEDSPFDACGPVAVATAENGSRFISHLGGWRWMHRSSVVDGEYPYEVDGLIISSSGVVRARPQDSTDPRRRSGDVVSRSALQELSVPKLASEIGRHNFRRMLILNVPTEWTTHDWEQNLQESLVCCRKVNATCWELVFHSMDHATQGVRKMSSIPLLSYIKMRPDPYGVELDDVSKITMMASGRIGSAWNAGSRPPPAMKEGRDNRWRGGNSFSSRGGYRGRKTGPAPQRVFAPSRAYHPPQSQKQAILPTPQGMPVPQGSEPNLKPQPQLSHFHNRPNGVPYGGARIPLPGDLSAGVPPRRLMVDNIIPAFATVMRMQELLGLRGGIMAVHLMPGGKSACVTFRDNESFHVAARCHGKVVMGQEISVKPMAGDVQTMPRFQANGEHTGVKVFAHGQLVADENDTGEEACGCSGFCVILL